MEMTVQQVARRAGISVRTLHYYHQIGLLFPSRITEAGYRLYDEAAVERLGQILFYRELEFPLEQIRAILSDPDYDRTRALQQHLSLIHISPPRGRPCAGSAPSSACPGKKKRSSSRASPVTSFSSADHHHCSQ